MHLPEELAGCDQRLLRDLLQLGPAHPRTRDHGESEHLWYYLMTYAFVEPKSYVQRNSEVDRSGRSTAKQSHTISSSGRELLKHVNEQLSQSN